MLQKPQIDKALITLEVEGKTSIYIVLAADGTIQRKGNGSTDETAPPLAIGVSNDGHLEALMAAADIQIFQHTGVLKMEDRKGKECVLSIVLNGVQGDEYLYRVFYGDLSEGPPRELAELLILAVKITEPWYQLELTKSTEQKKWWAFWK